ncbi:putative RiPP precursor [Mesorhizobium sp. B4-1-3]|nr:putative RiPP precursor [Mesorhizobium sp. B4-1-3]
MKKTYEKPVLRKRERLGTVAAQVVVISGPIGPA